ncbi:MAG: hypothetical protein QM504_11210 [Pseudomonadota bacterium]
MNPQTSLAAYQDVIFDNMPRETLELHALHNCPSDWYIELQTSMASVTDEQLIYISNIIEFKCIEEKVIINDCWQIGNVFGAKIGIHIDGSRISFYHRIIIINDTILFGMRKKVFNNCNQHKQIKERSLLRQNVSDIKELIKSKL